MKTMLSVGELNSSGNAGIQTDISVSLKFNISCKTALSAIVIEDSSETFIEKVDKTILEKQINTIFDNFDIDIIKIGLLPSFSCIEVIKQMLINATVPVIIDPIFIQKDKNFTISDKTSQEISTLFPYATIITPNIHEAKTLFTEELNINAPCPVLVKNIPLKNEFIDRLFYANNQTIDFKTNNQKEDSYEKRCLFVTSVASNLANDLSIEESINRSYDFLQELDL